MTFSVFSGIGHCMPFSGKGVGWRSSFLNANYMRSKGAVESGWCVESSDGDDDDCRGAKHVKNKEPPKGAGKITRLKTGNESETMFEEGVEEETGGVKEKCEGEQKEAGATHAMDNRDLPSKEKSGQKREKKKRDGEITGVSSSSSPSASPKLKKGRTKKGESVKEKEKEEKTEAGAKTKKGGNKKEGDEPLFRFSS